MKTVSFVLSLLLVTTGLIPYNVGSESQANAAFTQNAVAYIVPCPPFLEWLCGKN